MSGAKLEMANVLSSANAKLRTFIDEHGLNEPRS
jgi:hypothetical protein